MQPLIQLDSLPPLSLYIHIPWCLKKCPYCDFNSHQLTTNLPEQQYLDSLIADLTHALPLIWGRTIHSIFIGGGTPSLISGKGMDYLFSYIRSLLPVAPSAEISLEANPASVELQYIEDYRNAGINRISLGIQSFNDQHLKLLGRIHNQQEAKHAISTVRKYFTNFNLDLMYGLPTQNIAQAIADLTTALEFAPTHLSLYNLTIENNTHFAKYPPPNLPNNDLCYTMHEELNILLNQHGLTRYEISAYAKAGHKAQHNLNYWLFGDYLGIGAGAHSKLSFPTQIIRQMRQKNPNSYMQQILTKQHIIEDKIIPTGELSFEFMLNALRLIDGVDNSLFTQRTGLSLNSVLPTLLHAKEQGLLKLEQNKITPTPHGINFLNNLLELFL